MSTTNSNPEPTQVSPQALRLIATFFSRARKPPFMILICSWLRSIDVYEVLICSIQSFLLNRLQDFSQRTDEDLRYMQTFTQGLFEVISLYALFCKIRKRVNMGELGCKLRSFPTRLSTSPVPRSRDHSCSEPVA